MTRQTHDGQAGAEKDSKFSRHRRFGCFWREVLAEIPVFHYASRS
jgi:hypothetical protein